MLEKRMRKFAYVETPRFHCVDLRWAVRGEGGLAKKSSAFWERRMPTQLLPNVATP